MPRPPTIAARVDRLVRGAGVPVQAAAWSNGTGTTWATTTATGNGAASAATDTIATSVGRPATRTPVISR